MQVGFRIILFFAAVWFFALLIAVRKRWFARFKQGFRTSLFVSMISVAVWSPLLIAFWGYNAARQTLLNDTDNNLENIAVLVQQVIGDALKAAEQEAVPAAMSFSLQAEHELELGKHLSKETHDALHHANPRFLEAHIIGGAMDARSEIHPSYSKEFQRYVIEIRIPVTHPGHAPETFVVSYDLQDEIEQLVDRISFGKTGRIVVVNDDGHILAHPDKSRIGEDVSSNEAVKRVRSGDKDDDPIEQRDANGTKRLFTYRPVMLPKDGAPLIVLAEMDMAEIEAPVRKLTLEFVIGFAVLALIAVVLATQISRHVHQPIKKLLEMVKRINQGDLSATAEDVRNDEIGELGSALNQMVRVLNDRDRIKELFGRYVTTQVSEEVLRGQVKLGGAARKVTMLISDIRDFTSMSEQMSPEEVVKFLNSYFSEMVDAVFEYGGVLDKFLGDGLLAVFGSIGEETDHARRAVSTALRMQSRLQAINATRLENGLAPIKIGIGIHTGEVIVGNIGSQKRLEYTVIGDSVNTTSRLESLNKEFATMILISGATYDAVKDRFECRKMPEALLRGKTTKIAFYEVVGERNSEAVATVA